MLPAFFVCASWNISSEISRMSDGRACTYRANEEQVNWLKHVHIDFLRVPAFFFPPFLPVTESPCELENFFILLASTFKRWYDIGTHTVDTVTLTSTLTSDLQPPWRYCQCIRITHGPMIHHVNRCSPAACEVWKKTWEGDFGFIKLAYLLHHEVPFCSY